MQLPLTFLLDFFILPNARKNKLLLKRLFLSLQLETVVDFATMELDGGLTPSSQNRVEIDSLARFAVAEHNKKQNALVEFVRVLKAEEQVVAGMMHHLTIEANDAGKKKVYEAQVWVKAWMNFKELHEFKPAGGN